MVIFLLATPSVALAKGGEGPTSHKASRETLAGVGHPYPPAGGLLDPVSAPSCLRLCNSLNNLLQTKNTNLSVAVVCLVELVENSLHSILEEVRVWRELIQYSYMEAENNYRSNIP